MSRLQLCRTSIWFNLIPICSSLPNNIATKMHPICNTDSMASHKQSIHVVCCYGNPLIFLYLAASQRMQLIPVTDSIGSLQVEHISIVQLHNSFRMKLLWQLALGLLMGYNICKHSDGECPFMFHSWHCYHFFFKIWPKYSNKLCLMKLGALSY